MQIKFHNFKFTTTHKSNLSHYNTFQHECYSKDMYNLYSRITSNQYGDMRIIIPSVRWKTCILYYLTYITK
jgi:hypothetical protein